MKKILITLLTLTLLFGCSSTKTNHVERSDWADDVKKAINDFIDLYGNKSSNYSSNSYVVSDFDNTASIYDISHQLMMYQAEVMAYAFTPTQLKDIMKNGLSDLEIDRSEYGYGKGSYNDWIDDIVSAYSYLYDTYGPFTPSGLSEEDSKIIQQDPMWQEFASKIMNIYFLSRQIEKSESYYPWSLFYFYGMTEEDIYNLSKASHHKYRNVETASKSIKGPSDIESKVGPTEYKYIEGIQVTENIKEMWKAFTEAGIDVWVCSASEINAVRAAIDEFGLHDYCKGIMAMTPKYIDGKLINEYDYESGHVWYTDTNGKWKKGNVSINAEPQELGKVRAIQNICFKEYGVGPLAGFMDSTGDFNFCTEFKDLKLVICFNRADRKVTDGGGIIAPLAIYQKDNLGYDLKKANDNGDTLYVLQGRDENGLRTLCNSNSTIKLGETNKTLYKDEQNKLIYDYMVENKMTTEEVINTFSLLTNENDPNNKLGFKYGFLTEYSGYHSK